MSEPFAKAGEHALPRDYLMYEASMQDRPVLVANILGVDIVAPAQFRARLRGGFDVE